MGVVNMNIGDTDLQECNFTFSHTHFHAVGEHKLHPWEAAIVFPEQGHICSLTMHNKHKHGGSQLCQNTLI